MPTNGQCKLSLCSGFIIIIIFFLGGGGGGASRDRTAIESKKQPLRWLVQTQKVVCSAAYYH